MCFFYQSSIKTRFLKINCSLVEVIHENCTPSVHWCGRHFIILPWTMLNYKLMTFENPAEMDFVLGAVLLDSVQLWALGRLLLQVWVLDHLLSSIVILCIYSSIHDHTNSHCFLKMLQGNLKETLFAWPDKKSIEMTKKSERTLGENQCAYINGNSQYLFLRASGKNLGFPSEIRFTYICAV